MQWKTPVRVVALGPSDVSAVIRYKDGSSRKEECYYGSSFMSQSGRFLALTGDVVGVIVKDGTGKERKVY
jgi:hypothetical protein